jgi:hypothetical protein
MDKKKEKLYTIEDIVKAVNHWSMVSISKENVISFVEKQKKDQAYHLLFSNKTPYEISKILNDTWIDPDYELIVREKDDSQLSFWNH